MKGHTKKKCIQNRIKLVSLLMAALMIFGCNFSMPEILHTIADSLTPAPVAASTNPKTASSVSEQLQTESRLQRDNLGYIWGLGDVVNGEDDPLGKSFVNLRLASVFGDVGLKKQEEDYFTIENSSGRIALEMNYNDSKTTLINGSKWSLSNDTATTVNNYQTGFVGTGAIVIEKSYDGNNFSSELYTTDFAEKIAKPAQYNGNTYKELYNFSYDDLNRGVYIRVSFAYELSESYQETRYIIVPNSFYPYTYEETCYRYVNMLETATFYIANNSGAIGFHNLTNDTESLKEFVLNNTVSSLILEKKDAEKTAEQMALEKKIDEGKATKEEKLKYVNSFKKSVEEQMTDKTLIELAQLYRNGETLQSGDTTVTGFSIDTFHGDLSRITCTYNQMVPIPVRYNGQIFSKTGRYDFDVKTATGKIKTHTIYVNPKSQSASKGDYFDPDFITANNKRIYDIQSNYPVFEEGNINFKIKPVSNIVPMSGHIAKVTEEVNDKGEKEQKVTFIESFLSWDAKDSISSMKQNFGKIVKYNPSEGIKNSLNLEAGSYAAVFYTNEDFRDGITGDYYTFTYLFNVVNKNDNTGPVVNRINLNTLASVANFSSKYYGVELVGKNGNKVTYAFAYYERAYNFAYDLELSLIGSSEGSQYEILKQAHERAQKRVVDRYFDASDETTYLTIGDERGIGDFLTQDGEVDFGSDVLNMELAYDVVVFRSNEELSYMRTALPFLNNGSYAYIDKNGVIQRSKTDIRFISVADYESFSIKAVNCEDSKPFKLDYDLSVESQLKAQNAPSGKYEIIEVAKYGDGSEKSNSYYAIYINDENTATLRFTYLQGGAIDTGFVEKDNANQTFHVNSFVIHDIQDLLDPYSIVKITGNGQKNIYSIWEIENLCINTNGTYSVEIVNRLGYALQFNVIVENSVSEAVLTFDSAGGNEEKPQIAFVGISGDLPQPKRAGFTFAGWQAEDGAVFTTSMIPTAGGSHKLTALWEYERTEITVVDGDLKRPFTVFPGAKFSLPNLTKVGYTLVGFFYENEAGNKVYIHEISSVPNVPEMLLTAIWKKEGTPTIPPDNGSAQVVLVDGEVIDVLSPGSDNTVTLPQRSGDNAVFLGWMKVTGLEGVIYSDKMTNVPDTGVITLVAVYESETKDASGGGLVAGSTSNRFPSMFNGMQSYVFAGLLLLLLFFASVIVMKKRNAVKRGFAVAGTFPAAFSTGKKAELRLGLAILEAGEYSNMTATDQLRKRYNSAPHGTAHRGSRQKPLKSLWAAAICFLLVAIFACNPTMANYINTRALSYNFRSAQALSSTPDQEDILNLLQDEVAKKAKAETSSELSNTKQQVEAQSNKVITTEFEMTDDEAFLYSVEMLELTSLGYSVFPAEVIVDGTRIYGFAYTQGEEFFEREQEDNTVYVGTGFAAFANQIEITGNILERGLTINPLDNSKNNDTIITKYLLTFEETNKDDETEEICYKHYVSNGKYVRYALYDHAFHIAEYSNFDKNKTDYNLAYGKLYSYDDGFVVFDPALASGQTNVDLLAQSISQNITPEQAVMFFNSFIELQEEFYLTTELQSQVFISEVNFGEFLLSQQDELFLGISADEKRNLQKESEKLFDKGIYYYLYEDDNGVLQVDYSVDDSKQPKPNWGLVALGVIVVVAGVVLCFVCPPAGAKITAAGVTAITTGTVVATLVLGALAFGFIAAGTNLMLQGFAGTDWQDIDWASVAIETAIGAITGAMGRIFTVMVKAGKLAGTTAKVLAVVKYAASVVIQSFGAYASVMITTGNSSEAWYAFCFAFVISLAAGAIELVGDLKLINKVGKPAPDVTGQQEVKKVPTKDEIKKMRQKVTGEAKLEEIDFLKAQKEYYEKFGKLPDGGTKWGTAKNLSKKQVDAILNNGKFPSNFDGHHIKNVKSAVLEGNYASIGDTKNIVIGHRWKDHFKIWHNGNWKNLTDHVVIGGIPVTAIDRASLIKDLLKLINGG